MIETGYDTPASAMQLQVLCDRLGTRAEAAQLTSQALPLAAQLTPHSLPCTDIVDRYVSACQ